MLRLLSILGIGWVFIPLIPGLIQIFSPAFSFDAWQSLLADNQLPAALRSTLLSALGSTLLALLISCTIAILIYPSRAWQRLQQQMPVLLAFPHAAFAIGLVFLLAPSGWLARALALLFNWSNPPQWVTVKDSYGLMLMLALAIKESWFLLWVFASLFTEKKLLGQYAIAASLGYSKRQIWLSILLPQLLPKLVWPLLAVLAYGLSVVDMAQIIGPTTPPTLAVLTWQWLSDPDLTVQLKGHTAALVLLLLLIITVLLTRLAWWLLPLLKPYPKGIRHITQSVKVTSNSAAKPFFNASLKPSSWLPCGLVLIGWLALLLLVIWSFAGAWFFPQLLPSSLSFKSWLSANYTPMLTSLWLALACVFVALPSILLWLEWGPKHHQAWIYTPLVMPALPLAAAQYSILLPLKLEGTFIALVWSHLVWVLPYMMLVLVGAYQAFDERYMTTAQALGKNRLQACLLIKWPILLKPILAAVAIGFAVSIAQYLPTLFAGAGRFDTVTTEAVALSAGGNRRTLAVQALLQAALPLLMFALIAMIHHYHSRKHQELQ